MMRIMNNQVGLCHAISERYDLDIAVGFAPDAFVAVLAKYQRLAVLELYDLLASRVSLGEREPCAIVEDIAILQDFHERGALVYRRMLERVLQVGLENIDRTGHKCGFRSDGQRNGIEWTIHGPKGSRLGLFIKF